MGKKRYFPPSTKLEVVQRYLAGESSGSLGQAYGIRGTLVHQWVTEYRKHGQAGLRGLGRPSREAALAGVIVPEGRDEDEAAVHALASARQRIAALEQKIGQQQLEIDFFRHALRLLETSPPSATRPGATASTPSSGRGRSSKAD